MMIMRSAFALALIAFSAACAAPAHLDASAPAYTEEAITAESVRLNAWFEQKFDAAVARDPMRQTYLGIKDRYGEWSDPSEALELAELKFQRADVAK